MARKVIVRRDTPITYMEGLIKRDYMTFWRHHKDDLEAMADWIVDEAKSLVPVDTGVLRDSIHSRVSRSPRYPGLIVQATAKSKSKRSFDYALIQEEREDFVHEVGQAHYLEDAFYFVISSYYADYGLDMSDYIPRI